MAKRKNKNPGALPQLHPTRSFEQLVADATQSKLSAFIREEVRQATATRLQQQEQMIESLYLRILSVEGVLTEKLDGITREVLAGRIADLQDENDGLEAVKEGGIRVGDRVRLEIKTKSADQAEYQGSSRLMIDNMGLGQTLGSELESAAIGMTTGSTKEITFGKDNAMLASITISKISRTPAKAPEPSPEATETAPAAMANAEAPAEKSEADKAFDQPHAGHVDLTPGEKAQESTETPSVDSNAG